MTDYQEHFAATRPPEYVAWLAANSFEGLTLADRHRLWRRDRETYSLYSEVVMPPLNVPASAAPTGSRWTPAPTKAQPFQRPLPATTDPVKLHPGKQPTAPAKPRKKEKRTFSY